MLDPGRTQVAAHLREVDVLQPLYSLEFNHQLPVDANVQFVFTNQFAFIKDVYPLLKLGFDTTFAKLNLQSVFIDGFKESRSFFFVHGNASADYLFCE
jgi:hypothetical protein